MNQLSFDFAQVTSSEYDDDAVLGLGIDHYGAEEGGGPTAEAHSPFGFLGRPLDPTDGEGCTMLWWQEGSRTHAMALNDHRVRVKLPKLRKGGSAQYCAAGSYALFDGEDPSGSKRAGSYVLGVPYGTKSHVLSFDVRTAGSESLAIMHGEGMGFTATAGGDRSAMMRNASGDSYVEVNDRGIVLNGEIKTQGALSVGDPGLADALVKISALTQYLNILEAALKAAPGGPIVVASPWSTIEKSASTTFLKGS
jgi:hypothetical protein